MKKRIFLVGFRAVGKTTVGKMLADALQFDFLDTDTVVCERAGASVETIVQRGGWDEFRKRERAVLDLSLEVENVVVSTGGGAVLHQEFWKKKQDAAVIWLTAAEKTILTRISGDDKSDAQRPPLSDKDLEQEIRDTLSERTPLYMTVSDLTVDTERLNPDQIVAKIVSWYRQHGSS